METSNFMYGVWMLDEPLHCKMEVLGKSFLSRIAERDVIIIFPIFSENNEKPDPNLLIAPYDLPFSDTVWGRLRKWPEGLFDINALFVTFLGNSDDAAEIFKDFPRWKNKFNKLVLITTGEYAHPKQKPIYLLENNKGFYDGLELFSVSKTADIKREINTYQSSQLPLHLLSGNECYTATTIKELLMDAGSLKNILMPYELLQISYQSMINKDNRSAIIIAGTALEIAATDKLRNYYNEHNILSFEKEEKKHKMLGRKLEWFSELKIDIPVPNYKTAILEIRNNVVHEGILYDLPETQKYLHNCKTLIQFCCKDILEEN